MVLTLNWRHSLTIVFVSWSFFALVGMGVGGETSRSPWIWLSWLSWRPPFQTRSRSLSNKNEERCFMLKNILPWRNIFSPKPHSYFCVHPLMAWLGFFSTNFLPPYAAAWERKRWYVSLVIRTHVRRVAPWPRTFSRTLYQLSYRTAACLEETCFSTNLEWFHCLT